VLFQLTFPGMRAAIKVKDLTGNELCIVQVHHRINDLIDFTHSAERLKVFQKVMGFDFVHRCFYGSESDGVDADAMPGIFNCCFSINSALAPVGAALTMFGPMM
jgi:hypothetical protein